VRELNSTDRRIRERAGEFNRQVVRAVGLQGFAYKEFVLTKIALPWRVTDACLKVHKRGSLLWKSVVVTSILDGSQRRLPEGFAA
jgi:hypothetical protein